MGKIWDDMRSNFEDLKDSMNFRKWVRGGFESQEAKVTPDWSEHKVKFFSDELKKAQLYEKYINAFGFETIEFEMLPPVKLEIVKYGFFKV